MKYIKDFFSRYKLPDYVSDAEDIRLKMNLSNHQLYKSINSVTELREIYELKERINSTKDDIKILSDVLMKYPTSEVKFERDKKFSYRINEFDDCYSITIKGRVIDDILYEYNIRSFEDEWYLTYVYVCRDDEKYGFYNCCVYLCDTLDGVKQVILKFPNIKRKEFSMNIL